MESRLREWGVKGRGSQKILEIYIYITVSVCVPNNQSPSHSNHRDERRGSNVWYSQANPNGISPWKKHLHVFTIFSFRFAFGAIIYAELDATSARSRATCTENQRQQDDQHEENETEENPLANEDTDSEISKLWRTVRLVAAENPNVSNDKPTLTHEISIL